MHLITCLHSGSGGTPALHAKAAGGAGWQLRNLEPVPEYGMDGRILDLLILFMDAAGRPVHDGIRRMESGRRAGPGYRPAKGAFRRECHE